MCVFIPSAVEAAQVLYSVVDELLLLLLCLPCRTGKGAVALSLCWELGTARLTRQDSLRVKTLSGRFLKANKGFQVDVSLPFSQVERVAGRVVGFSFRQTGSDSGFTILLAV